MTSYIDEKYIHMLAPKLKLFKQKSQHLFNFRCPICGDSKKNELKCRGFIYERKGNYSFYCQNCFTPLKFDKFLKFVDPFLYKEYVFEKFASENNVVEDVARYITKPKFDHLIVKKPTRKLESLHLVSMESLPRTFPARKYLEQRKIPLADIYYTDDFSEYVQSQFPDQDKHLRKEPRIVIPFFDRQGQLLGVQGRAIGESKVRYITVKYDDTHKIFGWNKVDYNKPIYVTEGPIDSLMLTNAVATMDAALYNITGVLGVDANCIFIYDNEKRNRQIVNNMKRTIDLGYKICIFPNDFNYKDINEAVVDGMSPAIVHHIIDNNTYEGLQAKLVMNLWSKI